MSRKTFIEQAETIWFDETKFIDAEHARLYADRMVRRVDSALCDSGPWWHDDPLYIAPGKGERKYEPAPMPKDEDIDAVLAQIRRSKRA